MQQAYSETLAFVALVVSFWSLHRAELAKLAADARTVADDLRKLIAEARQTPPAPPAA